MRSQHFFSQKKIILETDKPSNCYACLAVLGQNRGGGNNLGIYDVSQYLQTTPPNLPPQNVVDDSFFLLDLGTNNISGIDGLVGNSDCINLIAA